MIYSHPITLAEFEITINAKPMHTVTINNPATIQKPADRSPAYQTSVTFKKGFAPDSLREVKAPDPLSAEYIITKFGLYLDEQSFSYLQDNYRHLIGSKLVEQRKQLMKQRDDERKRDFARKMETKLPRSSIRKIELNFSGCQPYSTSRYKVNFYIHGQEQPIFIEDLFSQDDIREIYSYRNITEQYAEFLESPYDFMYLRPCMDKDTQELHTASKLAPLLTDENLKHIHINRGGACVPKPNIYDLSIHFKDGTSKNMACRDPEVITRYFAPYLDDESFNASEIQPFLTDEIRVLRTSMVGKETFAAQEKFATSILTFFTMEKSERDLIISQEEGFRAMLGY